MCSRTARSPSATPSPRFSALSRNAFVLGGTGHVGRAIALSLLGDGWAVMLASRESPAPPGLEDVPVVHLDRDQEGALTPANGFDLVVDVVPFELAHADQLLELDVGAIVAISSASVYADDQGRTLDEAEATDDFPEFDGPIPETQSTVEPGDKTYSTRKAALELWLLEIARRIARTVGHEWTEVLLPRPEGRGAVGNTPWSAPKPFLVDMSAAARDLGYEPATTWTDAIDRQVEWLLEATRGRKWQEVLPRGAEYLQFEYDGEDAVV